MATVRLATDQNTFFSPGIACPSSYWSAYSDSRGVRTITTVTCCPVYGGSTSMSYQNKPKMLGTRSKSLFCTSVAAMGGGVVAFTQSSLRFTVTDTMAITAPAGVTAYGICMVYQSTELETASNSSTSSQSGAERDFQTTTNSSSSTSTQTDFAGRKDHELDNITAQVGPHSGSDTDTASGTVIASNGGLSTAATIATSWSPC